MYGCQDKEAMAELEEFKAQAELEEQNEAIFRHFTEELNKGNIEYFRETFAPDFANYDPSGATEPQSLEEVIEFFEIVFKGFPDINQAIQEVIAKGDKIIARSIFTGTHTGEFSGIPATGKKIRFSVIEIWTLKDGKCVELRTDYDKLGMMIQLGMELKPKEGEK
jgi:steroid delta-isomerase-like uncharacterized protein